MSARHPTLREVCQAANVSLYTASRALSGHEGVAEETRKRVIEAARTIGYVPNRLARNLKYDDSHTLGVLTANIANQFYSTLVKGIERIVQPAGYYCYVVDAVEDGVYDVERENKFVASLLEQRVAGIILTYVPTPDNMETLSAWRIPLVFVDCVPPTGFERFPAVMNEGRSGSWMVGRHFAAHGYRSWAFVGHTTTWESRYGRERGLREAAAEFGASLDVIEGGNDSRTACQAVQAFLAARPRAEWPRALYASNEPLLNGALRALREQRVSVPDEIATVGFDDFAWAELLVPPQTVVDQRIPEIGHMAGQQMLSALQGMPDLTGARLYTEPALIIRASCGGPAEAKRRIRAV